ncbi:MAG: hypothetical protein JXB26_05500 [Candidatus Aminicenantes bacterium]|nr:hypothetical protein [Candidatus Aminicenantes bacterium]
MFCKKSGRIFLFLLLTVPLFYPFSSYGFEDEDCLACHGKKNISQVMPDGKIRSIYVDPILWEEDVHKVAGKACVDCHTWAVPILHFREGNINVNCARCHPEEEEEYAKNIHLTFTPSTITPGKELPLCYHCHTRHHVLRLDHPNSSVHENNIGATCTACHAETMITNILKGSTIWKVSGHRKGDLRDKFDMKLCLNCHYEDSAHGNKSSHKDFCSRCHAVRTPGGPLLGPTHVDSGRWGTFTTIGNSLIVFLVFGTAVFLGIRSSGRIKKIITSWLAVPSEKNGPNQAQKTNTEGKINHEE